MPVLSSVVPLPACITCPGPVMLPPKVRRSERLNASTLLTDASHELSATSEQNATLPMMLPPVPPLPMTTAPPLIEVFPVKVAFPAVSSAGEFHPRALAETDMRTLASSGSHCSAASLQEAPVSEQIRLAARDALQPLL